MRLGKTVTELRDTMPLGEFNAWLTFHSQYPIDDYHIYHRPAALIAQCMAGGKIEDKLEWLQPSVKKESSNYDAAFVNTFKAFGLPLPGEK